MIPTARIPRELLVVGYMRRLFFDQFKKKRKGCWGCWEQYGDTFCCGGGESMYWKRFLNRINAASRTGLACLLIGSLINYVPTKELLGKMLAFTTYAPTIAISACDATLGKVMSNVWAIMQVAVFVMLETMIIFRFLKPKIEMVQMVACIGICSFIVTVSTRVNMMGKKVGLAQICMTFIAAHLDPDLDIVWMPLKFLASIFVGAAAALLAILIPYPRLAIVQVQQLVKSAVRGTSDQFQTVASAFFAADASTSYSICLHSKMLTKAASELMTELQQKQRDIVWELRACGSIPHFAKLTTGLKKLHLHLAGMELALQSTYLLQSSHLLRDMLEGPLMRVVQSSMALLDSAANLSMCSSSEYIDYLELTKEGKEALRLFDEALFTARKQAFYSVTVREPPLIIGNLTTIRSMEICSLDELLKRPAAEATRGIYGLNDGVGGHIEEADIISPIKRKFMSRVTTYFFLFNVRLYFEGAMNLLDDSWKTATAKKKKKKTTNKVSSVEALSDPDWRPGLELSMEDIETGSNNSRETGTSQNSENPSEERPFSLPFPSPPVQCTQCALSLPKVDKLCAWKFPKVDRVCAWNFFNKRLAPTRGQICKSLKISLAMMLSTIFGMVALPKNSHCAWAPVTVAIFLGNHQGGSFRLAILRIQGTVLGSIYGYLVVGASYINGYILLIALTLWVIASDFIRFSKSHGYSGVVSAQTAATMILGDIPSEIKSFALDRMTETFVGVMCFVFVETIIFPERAVILVKGELISSLRGLRNCVTNIVSAYTSHKCQSCRALALEEIRKLELVLRASLAKQSLLRAEAVSEPDLWFVPFPGDVFSRLIAVQGRMLNPLSLMAFSLQATVEENLDEHMQTLLKPLQASLIGLEEQVVSAIDFLQTLFIVPKLSSPLQDFFRWLLPPCLRSRRSRDEAKARRVARQRKSNTPLRMLGDRRRSVAGTPLHLKTSQKHFEKDFEQMLEELVTASKEAGGIVVSNSVMLSLSCLSFCLHEIMKETVELEKTVYELLQAERPWSILDHWDNDYVSKLWQKQNDAANKPTT